jgi:homoserine dehydrogenase
MASTINLGLAGFGTVGSGVASILEENKDWIARRTGGDIRIKTVLVRDTAKPRKQTPPPGTRLTAEPSDLWTDPDIDIVVELMGGTGAARTLVAESLGAGKHVVTANKALLAEHGQELFALAAEKERGLYHEASVAGGIPVIAALKESLAANRIEKMVGILNGTANFILSEMTDKGQDFAAALARAQELGYAEADPTFDVEGVDAAHKLVLLIRLAYGCHYPLSSLPVTGISSIAAEDIDFAAEFGYRIKLVGQVRSVSGRIEAGVFPALLPEHYMLANVSSNFNAVRVQGNAVGPVMLYGQGAGALPTGSAVLADVLSLISYDRRPNNTGYQELVLPDADILDPELAGFNHYFRFTVADRPGVLAQLARIMAEHNISISQVIQKGEASGRRVPVVFLTHQARTREVNAAITEIDAQEFTAAPTVHYRII